MNKPMVVPAAIDKVTDGLKAHPVFSIPTDRIVASKSNPRIHFDSAYIGELADDFAVRRARGDDHVILQPILVRPLTGDQFELVFGECRWRAAKKIGLAAMPATVRAMADEEVLEAQLVENGRRKDVHPLEEADGYRTWHEKYKKPVGEIAHRVGKTEGYVYARMKLCSLGAAGRNAFFENKVVLSVALALARIPDAKLQAKATKEVLRPRRWDAWNEGEDDFDTQDDQVADLLDAQPMTPQVALAHLRSRYMLKLSEAKFPIADTLLLPGAGACTTCPKKTGNQPELFADVGGKDLCSDPGCYKRKVDAHWKRQAGLAEQRGLKILPEKDATKLFPHGETEAVAESSGFVELTAKCKADPKGRTWAKLLGKNAPEATAIAKDPNGAAREIVPLKVVAAAAAKAGIDLQPREMSRAQSSLDSDYKHQQERARKALAIKRETARIAIEKIVAAAEKREVDHAFWENLALSMVGVSWHDVNVEVVKRRDLDEPKKRAPDILAKYIKALEVPALRGLVVELVASRGSYGAYQTGFGEQLVRAAKTYGVNLKAIEAGTKSVAAAAAKQKAAKEKARAKAPAAKKSTGKKKGPKTMLGEATAAAGLGELDDLEDGDLGE